MTREQIEEAIFDAIDEVNALVPDSMQLEKTPDAAIFGRGGKLDSLGLVNLVLAVEERIQRQGSNVSLTDERAMSQARSPFRSVESLTKFIEQSLEEAALRVQ